MEKTLTKAQFIALMQDMTCDEEGNTNQKCPLCGNDIIVEFFGNSTETKCKTEHCIHLVSRGI